MEGVVLQPSTPAAQIERRSNMTKNAQQAKAQEKKSEKNITLDRVPNFTNWIDALKKLSEKDLKQFSESGENSRTANKFLECRLYSLFNSDGWTDKIVLSINSTTELVLFSRLLPFCRGVQNINISFDKSYNKDEKKYNNDGIIEIILQRPSHNSELNALLEGNNIFLPELARDLKNRQTAEDMEEVNSILADYGINLTL